MADGYPGLFNFGQPGYIPAEEVLKLLPFTPQAKEARLAREMQQAQLLQMQQALEQNLKLNPLALQLLEAQIGEQQAARGAHQAQAGKLRAETPGTVDRWLGRGNVVADMVARLANAKASGAQGEYYNKMGTAHQTGALNDLLQNLPMFDEVTEQVEVPGLFGSKMKQQTRQVPSAARTAVLQQLAKLAGVSLPAGQPSGQPTSAVKPGMAEAFNAVQGKTATKPASTEKTLPREGWGSVAKDIIGRDNLQKIGPATRDSARAVGRAVPMVQSGIESVLEALGMAKPNAQAQQPPADLPQPPSVLTPEELQMLLNYARKLQ